MRKQSKADYRKHVEGSDEYSGVKSVPTPKSSGYPNEKPNTQTVKVRGTGAATKGNKSSDKLG